MWRAAVIAHINTHRHDRRVNIAQWGRTSPSRIGEIARQKNEKQIKSTQRTFFRFQHIQKILCITHSTHTHTYTQSRSHAYPIMHLAVTYSREHCNQERERKRKRERVLFLSVCLSFPATPTTTTNVECTERREGRGQNENAIYIYSHKFNIYRAVPYIACSSFHPNKTDTAHRTQRYARACTHNT